MEQLMSVQKNPETYTGQHRIKEENKEWLNDYIKKMEGRILKMKIALKEYYEALYRKDKSKKDRVIQELKDLLPFHSFELIKIFEIVKEITENSCESVNEIENSNFIIKSIKEAPSDIQRLFKCEIETREILKSPDNKTKSHEVVFKELAAKEFKGCITIDPEGERKSPDLRHSDSFSWFKSKIAYKDTELKSISGKKGNFMLNDSPIDGNKMYILSSKIQSILIMGSDLNKLTNTQYIYLYKDVFLRSNDDIIKEILLNSTLYARPNISLPSELLLRVFSGKSGAFYENTFYEYLPNNDLSLDKGKN
jgi:hypothetical protein